MKQIALLFSGAGRIAALCLGSAFVANLLPAEDALVRIAEDEAKKLAVSRVKPEYPAMAKQMRLAGKVQVDCVIDPDGGVEAVKVVNGNPLLSGAVTSAVKRWKFTPVQAHGKSVRAVTGLTFDFKL